jgi:hypothetical protein
MRKYFFLLLAFLLVLPSAAQDFTTTQNIELVPFIVANLDVQGLRPRGWHDQTNGIYIRGRDALDLTAVMMQSRAGTTADMLTNLQTEFALTAAPELLETLQSNFFEWSLYQFQRQQSNQSLTVDVAFAEDSETGRVYYVLMQTTAIFHEELRAELFIPAIQALSTVQRYVDPEGRFDVPIPTTWVLEDRETYAVLHDAESTILIYVSAVEGTDAPAALEGFWKTIYPDFDLTYDPGTDMRTINDPLRIGGLEMVYIITWQSGEDQDGTIKQGVARVYDGVIYMTLIETTIFQVQEHDEAIAMVDNNYRVTALLPAEVTAEATAEATADN